MMSNALRKFAEQTWHLIILLNRHITDNICLVLQTIMILNKFFILHFIMSAAMSYERDDVYRKGMRIKQNAAFCHLAFSI